MAALELRVELTDQLRLASDPRRRLRPTRQRERPANNRGVKRKGDKSDTYIVIYTLWRSLAGSDYVIVIPVIDEQQTSWFHAAFEVREGLPATIGSTVYGFVTFVSNSHETPVD